MYGTSRARRTLLLSLLGGLLALAWGVWTLRGSPLFRYLPLIGWAGGRERVLPLETATPVPVPGPPSAEQAVALVQGYNQADVLANRANDPGQLLPYVHPDGPLYRRLSEVYRRRIARGEVHYVQISRFWAAPPQVGSSEVLLETMEIWDETVMDGGSGEVRSSQVGLTTRQRYTLRRDAGGTWRIWELEILSAAGPDVP